MFGGEGVRVNRLQLQGYRGCYTRTKVKQVLGKVEGLQLPSPLALPSMVICSGH